MREKSKRFEMDMCSGPILKKMLIFSLPLMCSSILQLLFNAADVVVVGKFAGDNALAAVGSNTALINLLTNLCMGLSRGANVVAARYFGAKQKKDLEKTVHTAMLLSMLSGVLLCVLGLIGAKQMLIWMQTPEEVLSLAALYLRIYCLGMLPSMVYNFGSALLRAVGDTQRPLIYLLIAGCVNVVFNLIFVIVFHMSVAGVALATVISQFLSAGLILRCLMRSENGIHLDLHRLRLDRSKLLQILRIGLPAGFQGIVFALSNVVIQSSVNLFGNIVVAGNSAAANIEGFVYMAMNAFYQATLSFVSQNYGANQQRRIHRIVLAGQFCVIIVGVVLGNLAAYFGESLLHIYSDNPEVIAAGQIRLMAICRIYALCGMMDVMVGALRGIGYSVMPMVVSIAGVCGLRLVWLATVFQIPRFHRIDTVYASYPITWLITIVVYIAAFFWIRRKFFRKTGNIELREA